MYPTTGNTQNVEARDEAALQKQQTRVDITRAFEVTPGVEQTVREMFVYHEWDSEQIAKGARVRDALSLAVLSIIDNVPPCPTRSAAIRKIVESRMDCNAAITHRGQY